MVDVLVDLFLKALKETYDKDAHLIDYPSIRKSDIRYHVGERAIVFRTAHYFQNILESEKIFHDYHLDVEYNRNNDYPKYLELDKKRRTSPDLILHKRTSNEDNVLVAEFKGYWYTKKADIEHDMEKLKKFTDQNSMYKFKIGLFVNLGKTYDETKIIVYKNKVPCEYLVSNIKRYSTEEIG